MNGKLHLVASMEWIDLRKSPDKWPIQEKIYLFFVYRPKLEGNNRYHFCLGRTNSNKEVDSPFVDIDGNSIHSNGSFVSGYTELPNIREFDNFGGK